MTSIDDASLIDKAWETYVNDIKEAIEQGYLDDSIRQIARACIDRRDTLRDEDVETPTRNVLPKNPVHVVPEPEPRGNSANKAPAPQDNLEGKSLKHVRGLARAAGIDPIIGVPKTELIRQLRNQSQAEAVAYSEPSIARRGGKKSSGRRSFGGDTTFRYTDGKLYSKADVRGRIFHYEADGRGYWGKIAGAGPRSFKVTWVHNSDGDLCYDKDQSHMVCAPAKYRDTSTRDGRKVTFMGLTHFDALMKTLIPVPEP